MLLAAYLIVFNKTELSTLTPYTIAGLTHNKPIPNNINRLATHYKYLLLQIPLDSNIITGNINFDFLRMKCTVTI